MPEVYVVAHIVPKFCELPHKTRRLMFSCERINFVEATHKTFDILCHGHAISGDGVIY